MNNFEKITTNINDLAIAVMGTNIIADIQRRTLKEYTKEKFNYSEGTRRNIEYFKQWLQQESEG